MRICVVGAGLAGTLLAWRLAADPGVRVTLLTGGTRQDATAASGGLVRAFETDPESARLAGLGLAELRASRVLRQWAGYRPGMSLYVPTAAPQGLPQSAELCRRPRLEREFGLHALPEGAAGVLEHSAGHISPDGLRRAVLADLVARGASVRPGRLRTLTAEGSGIRHRTATGPGTSDALVLATGAWTPRLLRSLGLAADGTAWRTKVIQCAVYQAAGQLPPAFVDETSGLYGRPAGPGRMLLGLPTERWGAGPGAARFLGREERAVRTVAAHRLPGLSLGRLLRPVAAVDAYGPAGRLVLTPVAGAAGPLFAFTGGSGGSAKLALAASREGANDLLHQLTHAGTALSTASSRRETS